MAQVAQNSGCADTFGRIEYIYICIGVVNAKVNPSGSPESPGKLRVDSG